MNVNKIFEYSLNGLYGHPYAELILKWFDPQGYVEFYPDLQILLEHEYDHEALLYHFVNTGFHEKRIYCHQMLRFFDPDYYRSCCNEEVKLLSNEQLMVHWVYEGVFKGCAANEMTYKALNSPFQVFNMGRVGSFSIMQAIAGSGFNKPIHTHSDFEFSRSYLGSSLTFTQIMEMRLISDVYPPLFIVSGVRDPISWLFSSFDRYIDINALDLDKFEQGMTSQISHGRLFFALNFFMNPLFFGFKIFEKGFNAKKGYGHYKFGRHDLLIYRVDKLNIIERIIGNILGITDFRIEVVNQSSKFISSTFTSEAKKKFIDDNMMEAIRKSAYMQYFFTTKEQFKIYDEFY